MAEGLQQRLREIEEFADAAMRDDEQFVRLVAQELKTLADQVRIAVAEGDAEHAALTMHGLQEARLQLLFTMSDPEARRVGMGGLYQSDDAVASAAAKGRVFRPGRRDGALGALTQWIESYLERHRDATNEKIRQALLFDPEGDKPSDHDPPDTIARYRNAPVSRKQLRERARECRDRLRIPR